MSLNRFAKCLISQRLNNKADRRKIFFFCKCHGDVLNFQPQQTSSILTMNGLDHTTCSQNCSISLEKNSLVMTFSHCVALEILCTIIITNEHFQKLKRQTSAEPDVKRHHLINPIASDNQRVTYQCYEVCCFRQQWCTEYP